MKTAYRSFLMFYSIQYGMEKNNLVNFVYLIFI
jgi:hypothetical protein